jgi:S1-C subfamily serine protease
LELWDERKVPGRVIARDPVNDLAAVRIHAEGLQPAVAGDSSRIHVGQLIVAVGHPLGIRDNATLGIISAVDCVIRRGRHECSVVHADVDLAPGNSGGPLADMEGRVLGIASMIVSPGIAVAVPSNVASRFARSLENSKAVV